MTAGLVADFRAFLREHKVSLCDRCGRVCPDLFHLKMIVILNALRRTSSTQERHFS
jgi:hypothetical protein